MDFSPVSVAATASAAMTRTRRGLTLLLLLAGGCLGSSSDQQIALGAPSDSLAVKRAERITDGRRALRGASWDAKAVAFFNGPRAYLVYDLGELTPIEAAYLQGDNNDEFILEVSEDGTTYTPLWTAPAVVGNGLQTRIADGLGARGRFVRVRAKGGDRSVSLSELQLFTAKPSPWPPSLAVDFEATASIWAQLALLVFGLLSVLVAALDRAGSKRGLALWTLSGGAAIAVCSAIVSGWPMETSFIDLSRAVAATVACAVVLRLGLQPDGARTRMLTGLLAAMALLSISTFYNFGHPQFFDSAKRQPTYVHTWDMRVYFPAVKYFDELGYDGVYLASVKAYADEELDGSLNSISDVRLRDLRDYEMRSVADLADEIHAVEQRFSPERWAELKQDMSYFWRAMGKRDYLGSLRDHGGNATPAWLLAAYMIYGSTDANESTLLWGALFDPLLLLIFFAVAWRTFGLRTALVCMVAYGATSVYQFGSNWGGSTLRNDWMVLIGLGVCALKSRRLVLAGMLLGWAAMIRAFPALALAFLVAPVAWGLFAALRNPEHGAKPLDEVVPLFKVAAGALLIALVIGAASTTTFGWNESWGAWSEKISMHATRPNVNHLGITALASYDHDNLWHVLRERGEDPGLWGPRTAQTMKDRRWLIVLGMLFYTGLAVRASRRLRLSDAALIGTMMIPIYFYPSNYYLHIAFIWPLMLAAWPGGTRTREWSLVAATVLAACAIEWFGWLIPGNYGRFLFWSGVLLATIAVILAIPIFGDRRREATSGTA